MGAGGRRGRTVRLCARVTGGHGKVGQLLDVLLSFAGNVTTTKDGSVVRKCRVADKSASIIFSLWNEQADAIEAGDILRLMKGYGDSILTFTNTHKKSKPNSVIFSS